MLRSTLVILVVVVTIHIVARPIAAIEFRQFSFGASDLSWVGEPAWSPDGSRLAYTSYSIDTSRLYMLLSEIAVVSVNKNEWTEFPNRFPPGYYDAIVSEPAWSPTGDRIVFTISGDIWIGGVADTTLTSLGIQGHRPTWSPDGSRIAYTGYATGFHDGVYIVPATGGQPVLRVAGVNPAWSPDGQWLAYASPYGGQRDIWIMPAGGGEPRALTQDAAVDDDPSWSPDGRFIAFGSDRSGNFDVWVVRVADGALAQVTTDPADDRDPTWSPDGKSIAFVSGYGDIWIASDLGTIAVEAVSWSQVKELFR